jgi:transcriptional regulator with XRE-family HTH domain
MRKVLFYSRPGCGVQALKNKSIYTAELLEFCAQLRQIREDAGLNQTQLARVFGRLQSFVSTVERGQVRLDLAQARLWCQACGTTLAVLAEVVEKRIAALPPAVKRRKPRVVKKAAKKSTGLADRSVRS